MREHFDPQVSMRLGMCPGVQSGYIWAPVTALYGQGIFEGENHGSGYLTLDPMAHNDSSSRGKLKTRTSKVLEIRHLEDGWTNAVETPKCCPSDGGVIIQ